MKIPKEFADLIKNQIKKERNPVEDASFFDYLDFITVDRNCDNCGNWMTTQDDKGTQCKYHKTCLSWSFGYRPGWVAKEDVTCER